MNVPSVNRSVFVPIEQAHRVRWMCEGMLVTRPNGRKRYYSYADWVCIDAEDAHHLGYSIEWDELAIIMRRADLDEQLHGLWRGMDVREIGPVQLAQRRIDVARHNRRFEMEQRYYEQ